MRSLGGLELPQGGFLNLADALFSDAEQLRDLIKGVGTFACDFKGARWDRVVVGEQGVIEVSDAEVVAALCLLAGRLKCSASALGLLENVEVNPHLGDDV